MHELQLMVFFFFFFFFPEATGPVHPESAPVQAFAVFSRKPVPLAADVHHQPQPCSLFSRTPSLHPTRTKAQETSQKAAAERHACPNLRCATSSNGHPPSPNSPTPSSSSATTTTTTTTATVTAASPPSVALIRGCPDASE